MNICLQVFVYLFSILLAVYVGAELLGHTVTNILKNCHTV